MLIFTVRSFTWGVHSRASNDLEVFECSNTSEFEFGIRIFKYSSVRKPVNFEFGIRIFKYSNVRIP